jgi:hypothetical protein
LLDKHEATEKQLWEPYHRLDRVWTREYRKSWRLLNRIIGTKAATLQGVAAQMKILDKEGVLTEQHNRAVHKHVVAIARNLNRLVAAMPAGGNNG